MRQACRTRVHWVTFNPAQLVPSQRCSQRGLQMPMGSRAEPGYAGACRSGAGFGTARGGRGFGVPLPICGTGGNLGLSAAKARPSAAVDAIPSARASAMTILRFAKAFMAIIISLPIAFAFRFQSRMW